MSRGLESVILEIQRRLGGVKDSTFLGEIRDIAEILGGLSDAVSMHKAALEQNKARAGDFFPNIDEVEHMLSGERGPIIHFFAHLAGAIANSEIRNMNGYLELERDYKRYVADRLPDSRSTSRRADSVDLMDPSAERAVQTTISLSQSSMALMVYYGAILSDNLNAAYERISRINKYLRQRFVKDEEQERPKGHSMIILRDPEGEEERAKHVKIKLVDGNPVLTEVLLNIADALPQFVERSFENKKSKKGKKTVVKEVSKYAVDRLAQDLLTLSHPIVVEYIQDPKTFFTGMGSILQTSYSFFERAREHHLKLVDMPHIRVAAPDGVDPNELINKVRRSGRKVSRLIDKVRNADFDAIVQREEEYAPDTKREADSAKIRERMLRHLYDSIIELSRMPESDEEENNQREEKAKEAVRKAIEMKFEIEQISSSYDARKLKQDKRGDNEYYEGAQGHIGMFHFSRKPAPRIRMEEVVGRSFEEAKTHLAEIVDTGNFPHIMQRTAPGGKLRNNMILIGPYGCGKTELARAVSGDRRVIGACVSVRNTLTAYMHESVNNVGRVYDAARRLFIDGRESKPVILVLDEFDAWFAKGNGHYSDKDMQQIELVLSEVLDGMGDYHGVVTMAMTNEPLAIPPRLMRRFRYVDVVGELTTEERADILRMNLEKSLPVHADINAERYLGWAERLNNAPGDVVRKVVDELHFVYMRGFLARHPAEAHRIERVLYKRAQREGLLDDNDSSYIRGRLAKYSLVTPDEVNAKVDELLTRPPIVMQINKAREVYRDARRLKEELAEPDRVFGLRSRRDRIGTE